MPSIRNAAGDALNPANPRGFSWIVASAILIHSIFELEEEASCRWREFPVQAQVEQQIAADQLHLLADQFRLLRDLSVLDVEFAPQHREQLAAFRVRSSRRCRDRPLLRCRLDRHFPAEQLLAESPGEVLALRAELQSLVGTRLDVTPIRVLVVRDDRINHATNRTWRLACEPGGFLNGEKI